MNHFDSNSHFECSLTFPIRFQVTFWMQHNMFNTNRNELIVLHRIFWIQFNIFITDRVNSADGSARFQAAFWIQFNIFNTIISYMMNKVQHFQYWSKSVNCPPSEYLDAVEHFHQWPDVMDMILYIVFHIFHVYIILLSHRFNHWTWILGDAGSNPHSNILIFWLHFNILTFWMNKVSDGRCKMLKWDQNVKMGSKC